MNLLKMNNEEWIPLNGCNECINSEFCDELGSCAGLYILHNIDPKVNKRKLVNKIRHIHGFWEISKQIDDMGQKTKSISTSVPPVRLTTFEKLCIKAINTRQSHSDEYQEHLDKLSTDWNLGKGY